MKEEEAAKVMATIRDLSQDILNAKHEVAAEIEHWLQMHLHAQPDREKAWMLFTDWMKFKKMLKSKYGVS